MEVNIKNDLDNFKSEVVSEIRAIIQEQAKEQFKLTWIEGKKVPGLLGISSKTWQNWRDKRVIPFAQFGAKIYVKLEDIHQLLESNRIESK